LSVVELSTLPYAFPEAADTITAMVNAAILHENKDDVFIVRSIFRFVCLPWQEAEFPATADKREVTLVVTAS
jgi:hypothetical protein